MTRLSPTVSIIVPFHDAGLYLAQAIESVLSQTYSDWELLLVDDSSRDDGPSIAKTFANSDRRIRYIPSTGSRLRTGATRNVGVRLAAGEFVALLDADDVWESRKLEEQLAVFEAFPDVSLLYGRSTYWHSWRQPAPLDFAPEAGVDYWTVIEPPELLLRIYPLGPGPAPAVSSLIFRRRLLERVGGFEEHLSNAYEDQAFLAKTYLTERVLVADRTWDRYRQHQPSVTALIDRDGGYWAARLEFLKWLKGYLSRQAHIDTRVQTALEGALFLAGDTDAPAARVAAVTEVAVSPAPLLLGGNVEAPEVGRLAVRDLQVEGWVLGRERKARHILVEQGGACLARFVVGHHRPDIGAAFPMTPLSAVSGFIGIVDGGHFSRASCGSEPSSRALRRQTSRRLSLDSRVWRRCVPSWLFASRFGRHFDISLIY